MFRDESSSASAMNHSNKGMATSHKGMATSSFLLPCSPDRRVDRVDRGPTEAPLLRLRPGGV